METISVIVPCYNEEDALPLFLPAMEPILETLPVRWQLIFVDDGSTDGTLPLLKDIRGKDDRCQYLSFSRNFGKEAALYAGLQHAEGDYVAVMDVDLQDPPSLLPEMYRRLQQEPLDCVAACRKDRQGEPWLRSKLSDAFYRVINHFTDTPMIPGVRDFRLMRRNMVDAILELGEYNRFSKGIFGWVGFRTEYLSYENVERSAGSTKWSLKQLFSYALDGITDFSVAPLSLATILGGTFCVLSLLAIILIVIRTLIWGDPVAGWPSMACIVFLVSGVQLLCSGIIGQYLSKTYLEGKHRPIYILREASHEAHQSSDS